MQTMNHIVDAGELGEIDTVATYIRHSGKDEPTTIEIRSVMWQGMDIVDFLSRDAMDMLIEEISYSEGDYLYERRAA